MNLILLLIQKVKTRGFKRELKNPCTYLTLKVFVILLLSSTGVIAYALPTGGNASAGGISIKSGTGNMTITQSTANAVINWQSFNIGQEETVQFLQPSSSSVALNRVTGSDPSNILGNLSANGKVFLINPNGILFGTGAQVNVGSFVASTLNISEEDFLSGSYKFSGTGNGIIVNQGTISINADGGYVALLGAHIINDNAITARLGTVAMSAGTAITLDVVGDGLLNVTVNQGAVNALVQNGGLIRADGGLVLLTTQATGNLLQSAVNNTGVIQAQTIDNHSGTIKLLADKQSGTVNVSGTLAAEGGVNSGDGGFIETSASRVVVASNAKIDTLASHGNTGLWLLDPVSYTIAATGGDETPASITASLASSNRLISASNDITVSNAISIATPQTLTLNAGHDVVINAPITAVPAGAGLVLIAGNNVSLNASLTVTGASSSINISAVNDVIIAAPVLAVGAASTISINAGLDLISNAAITTVGAGSAIKMDAGRNVNINGAIASSAAGSSISLISGLAATGPSASGGTVTIAPSATVNSITTTIRFNPVNYANTSSEIVAYISKVTGILDAKAWVFTQGNNKIYDGTNTAILTFLGNPLSGGNVTLVSGTATFDTQDAGTNKTLSFSGATLGGVDANKFALFATSGTTTGNVTPASLTVTMANATKTYGQTIALTGFTASGLVNAETIGAFSETSPGTVASASVAGSPYVITPSMASGGTFKPSNYAIIYINGVLTVTPQPIIAMLKQLVPVPAVTPVSTDVQSATPAELLSVTPVDISPVEQPSENPNI